ncbi:MAG: dienelactone hydrolase family protein [Acidobacteria bacterium]|nr:dienelactone hydrolase family protein [Acidobacteriota bacterium]
MKLEPIHAAGRVAYSGIDVREAERAMILVHGRGATPESILALADELPGDLGFAFVAPGASESSAHPRSWYPNSFLAPIEANEPGLSSGLAKIEETVMELGEHGIGPENTVLLGFSQGACLTAEFAARHARRWGGVVALAGGLVGDGDAPRDYAGAFHGTPVFLGCSDRDPHVPVSRVDETEEVLRRMGARVEKRIYPGMPHTVIRDELDWVENTMRRLANQQQHESTQVGIHSG